MKTTFLLIKKLVTEENNLAILVAVKRDHEVVLAESKLKINVNKPISIAAQNNDDTLNLITSLITLTETGKALKPDGLFWPEFSAWMKPFCVCT